MNPRFIPNFLAWILVAGSATALPANQPCLRLADLLVEQPEVLEKAEDLLRKEMEPCKSPGDEAACNADVEACLGYLYLSAVEQHLAGDAPDRSTKAEKLLCDALPHLKRAYFELGRTEEGAINLALAYRSLGDLETAAEVLADFAYSADPRNPELLMEAGDTYRDDGDILEAVALYRKASRLSPFSETAQRRLLDIRETENDGLKQSNRFLRRHLFLVARDGYEKVIQEGQPFRATENWIGAPALVGWVQAIAALGNASARDLERLPSSEQWDFEGLKELERLLEDPAEGASQLDWWTEDNAKNWWAPGNFRFSARSAAASLLLDLSRPYLATQRYKKAQAVLERGFELAQFQNDYNDPGAFTRIDLARELGRFYLSHRQTVDADGVKFNQLIAELQGDLPRIDDDKLDLRLREDYLETLGWLMIASARASAPVDTARLAAGLEHIDQAIKLDGEIWEDRPDYAFPQPDLEQLAGDEHLKANRKEKAFELYLAAARGYLDLDALAGAERVLDLAQDTASGTKEEISAIEKLRNILKVRRNPTPWEPDTSHEGAGALAEFSSRQLFKTLVDAGNRSSRLGDSDQALRYHIEAIRILSRLNMLPSNRDVERFQSAIDTILTAKPVISLEMSIEFRLNFLISPYFVKAFALPSYSGRPGAKLRIGIDVFLAAELRRLLLEMKQEVPSVLTLGLDRRSLYIFPGYGEDKEEAAESLKSFIKSSVVRVSYAEREDIRHARINRIYIRKGFGLRSESSVAGSPPAAPKRCRAIQP